MRSNIIFNEILIILAMGLSLPLMAKVSWQVRPSSALYLQKNTAMKPLFLKAVESGGKGVSYEVFSNTCPFDIFYDEKDGGVELSGTVPQTERRKCSFKVYPFTPFSQGETISVDLVLKSFSQKLSLLALEWESFPTKNLIEVKAGEEISPLEIKAKGPKEIGPISYDHSLEESCPKGLEYVTGGEKLVFTGRFPQVDSTQNCKVTVKVLTKKKFIEERSFHFKITPRLMDNVFFYWELFPPKEMAILKGEAFGPLHFKAGTTSNKALEYRVKDTNCPFQFNSQVNGQDLFISGQVPLNTTQESCYLKISPFIENQEGDSQKVEFQLKENERNLNFFKWVDTLRNNHPITIKKNQRFPHIEVMATREGGDKVIYLLDQITCSGEFWGRRTVQGSFVIYGEVPHWVEKEDCFVRIKGQSKGKDPIFKVIQFSLHP